MDDLSRMTARVRHTVTGSSDTGGGGLPTGGAPHQQLVTDAEGKALWEDRTHYTYIGTGEILPSSDLLYSNGQFVSVNPATNLPSNGASCTVTWNGVDYGCDAEEVDIEGVVCPVLGNTSIAGGTQTTDDPFCVVLLGSEMAANVGVGVMAFALDGSVTVTIAITGQAEIAKKLDRKFIPEAANSNVRNGLGAGSIVAGSPTSTSEGMFSASFGFEANANGLASHAEGWSATADGDAAHAEGRGTTASGDYAHAEGSETVASGDYAHAEGSNTQAIGADAHAEGWYTTARGSGSHAEGRNTKAYSNWQHVQGMFNHIDYNNKYAHIVGNGKSGDALSNAHTLDWDGNAWYQGYVEGTKLILPSPNGTRWAITVADDGTLSAAAVTE